VIAGALGRRGLALEVARRPGRARSLQTGAAERTGSTTDRAPRDQRRECREQAAEQQDRDGPPARQDPAIASTGR